MIYWGMAQRGVHVGGEEPPPGLLCSAELGVLNRLRIPKRRADWLLGRAAVKQLCCAHLGRSGLPTDPAELAVMNAEDGAPQVLAADGSRRLPLTISLSHSGGQAVAALCEGSDLPLGIDIELCEPRPAGFIADFFTPAEVALVEASPALERDRVTTEVWSLKEAVLKALRLGLNADTRQVEVRPRAEPTPGWGAAEIIGPLGAGGRAFVRDMGSFVVSLAWLGPPELGAPTNGLELS